MLRPVKEPTAIHNHACILAGMFTYRYFSPFSLYNCRDYIQRISVDEIKEKGYQLKANSRFPARYITDTGFADDIALTNQSLNSAESLLQDATCVGLNS